MMLERGEEEEEEFFVEGRVSRGDRCRPPVGDLRGESHVAIGVGHPWVT